MKNERAAARIALPLYLGAIYATLGTARQITNALRDAGMLRATVVVAFVLAAMVVVAFIARHPRLRTARSIGALLLCAAIYGAVTLPMASPEEKLHFIEYGLVALLAFAAAPMKLHRWRRYLFAAVLCAIAGWIDEGIQALLPTRYYDLRDVGFNAAAGVMALAALALFRSIARRQTGPPALADPSDTRDPARADEG